MYIDASYMYIDALLYMYIDAPGTNNAPSVQEDKKPP